MYRFIFDQLPEGIVEEIQPSFNSLPETDHADGKFRLRRYSMIDYLGMDLGRCEFIQSSEYNKYQGDVLRKFEPIDQSVLDSHAFEMMHKIYRTASDISIEDLEVHQMRVKIPDDQRMAQLSPEGPHQDGYDYVGMFSVSRHNIEGGDLMAYVSGDEFPMITHVLEPGQFVIVNDVEMLHDGAPITRVDDSEESYMDIFVFTGRRQD